MSFTFDPYSLKNGQVSEANDVILTNPTALAELERYWASLPRTDGIPLRKDVDPMSLSGLLEDCFILERVAPRVARIRVAGRGITKLMGMEPRGLPMTAAFLPAARADFGRHLEAAFNGPSVVELALEAPRGIGQPKLEGKILMLPLRDENGEVTRILGALVMSGRRGVGGRRFALSNKSEDRIDAIRPVTRPAPASVTGGKPTLKAISGGAQGMKMAGDKAALRLVVSNP